MAQNITLLGASYSDVPSVLLPKTGGGTASFTDVTDTTATASDVALGTYFYTAAGVKTAGTASGYVTQDQSGFIVLPPDGGGLAALEYEQGIWSPESDVVEAVISFTKTHTTAPFYYVISDVENAYDSTTYTNYAVVYCNHHQLFGSTIYPSSTSANYGIVCYRYRTTGSTSLGTGTTALTYPYTNEGSSTSSYSRFWATESGIKASTVATTARYWRTGHDYKWLAVWNPPA